MSISQMISEFSTTDYIALYGAVVATIAMIITLVQLYNSIQDKKTKLEITVNQNEISYKNTTKPFLCSVNVINKGNYKIFINENYAAAIDGTRHDAYLKENDSFFGNSLSEKLTPQKEESVEPNSTKIYNIYSNNDKKINLKKVLVVDGKNKRWEYRV